MADLIDRRSALSVCKEYGWIDGEDFVDGYNTAIRDIREAIKELPTIEPEVRHAYWEPSEVGEYHCTHCGVECNIDLFHKALLNPFCGNCGAKMDGGIDNG